MTETLLYSEKRLVSFPIGVTIDLSDIRIWDASFSDIDRSVNTLDTDLFWLAQYAERHAPEESLGAIIPALIQREKGYGRHDSKIVPTYLQHHFLSIASCVTAVLQRNYETKKSTWTGTLGQLIGVGPGLTPSGDDFLAGVILGIVKLSQPYTALRFARNLCVLAENRTTSVSYAFFRSLALGRLSQRQTHLLNAFGSGVLNERNKVIERLQNWGSTSGWDMLAGFAFSLALLKSRRPPNTCRARMEALC